MKGSPYVYQRNVKIRKEMFGMIQSYNNYSLIEFSFIWFFLLSELSYPFLVLHTSHAHLDSSGLFPFHHPKKKIMEIAQQLMKEQNKN